MKQQRIGIMGGTFNPIHNGHLIIADNAREQFQLDKVIFMPTGLMPHKEYGGRGMAAHRCEMVRLAIEGNEHFLLSDYEVYRTEVNYTYQTLAVIQEQYPQAQLYFILGADSLFGFQKWRCPERICEQAIVLAAVRDNMTENKVDEQIRILREQYGSQIYRLESPNFSVSSNSIRSRIREHQTIRYMVPDPVRDYIARQGLYTGIDNE